MVTLTPTQIDCWKGYTHVCHNTTIYRLDDTTALTNLSCKMMSVCMRYDYERYYRPRGVWGWFWSRPRHETDESIRIYKNYNDTWKFMWLLSMIADNNVISVVDQQWFHVQLEKSDASFKLMSYEL